MRRPEIVNQIKEVMRKVAPTAKTILYGSEARGDAREDSDIDLLVLLDKDRPNFDDEANISYPLYELEIKTGVSINPLIMSKYSWENRPFKTPFYINVLNDIPTQTHSGVKTMLGLHFISKGLLPISAGKTFSYYFNIC